jgi:hypothetical protein
MAELSFDGIVIEHKLAFEIREPDAYKGGGSTLSIIAGVAVSIAVPFLAPTVAGAIFGASAMAGLGGAILAGGVGAAMGAAGAYLTGNDPLMGALTGGLGAGAIQGLGMFGAVQGGQGLFGGVGGGLMGGSAATTAGTAGMNSVGAGATFGQVGQLAGGATATELGLGAATLGAPAAGSAAAAPGFMGLGATQTQMLTNAALGAAPMALGSLGAELLGPSDQALENEQMFQEQYEQQMGLYDTAMASANNISPELMAQNLAGQAQLRTAQLIAEGDPGATREGYDPARVAGLQRRAVVDGSTMAGTGYMQGMMAGQQMKDQAISSAARMFPDYASYLDGLSNYGVDAERKKRAEGISDMATPFFNALTSSTNSSQVVPNITVNMGK